MKVLFRKVHIDNKGGVFLRLFRREGKGGEEEKKNIEEYPCDLCSFVAKNKGGLVLHKLGKHNQ